MLTQGIRGATTVDNNDKTSVKEAVVELLNHMLGKNNIEVNLFHFEITLFCFYQPSTHFVRGPNHR